jgi:hypothetical protein
LALAAALNGGTSWLCWRCRRDRNARVDGFVRAVFAAFPGTVELDCRGNPLRVARCERKRGKRDRVMPGQLELL